MSSVDPFELEGRTQSDPRPTFELNEASKQTSFMGDLVRSPYTVLEGLGSGAAKGEALLGGLVNFAGRSFSTVGKPGPVDEEIGGLLERSGESIQQDARQRVKAMTPDATTTGTATRVLHSVSSGIEEYTLGALAGGGIGAAAVVGGSEGVNRDLELQEQGVDRTTAAESGVLTGLTSAAGVLLPAAYGTSLLTRLATGAASNIGMGMVGRYGDHLILEANGYPEMAEQQKAIDLSQILVDGALGATFGGLHHLADPGKTDAALTQNLANADRRSAPGIPTDPKAANAHQAALESATESILKGDPVDVSDAGLDDSAFLSRPAPNISEPQRIMINAFKESGYFEADADIRSLEKALRERGQQVESEPEGVPRGTEQAEESLVLDRSFRQPEILNSSKAEESTKTVESVVDDLSVPRREPRWIINGRPVWDMSPDELASAAEDLRNHDVKVLTAAFGDEAVARKFARLAESNSDRAYEKADAMVNELSPEKQKVIEVWERGEGGPNISADEVAILERRVREMGSAESPQELANLLKYSLTKLGEKTNPHEMDIDELGAAMELKEAHRLATERGWNTSDLSHTAVRMAAQRYQDPVDAEFMLRRFIKGKEPVGSPIDQALLERPNLVIPDENGQPMLARDAIESSKPEENYGKAIEAATDCFARRGG